MYICNWSTLNKLIIIIKSWFDVPKTQISIFIIFARTGVLFDDAFSVKVSLRISWSVNVTESQETENLITFTEEILNGKLHFLRSVWNSIPTSCSNFTCKDLAQKTNRSSFIQIINTFDITQIQRVSYWVSSSLNQPYTMKGLWNQQSGKRRINSLAIAI